MKLPTCRPGTIALMIAIATALLLAVPCVAEPPQVRYVPQATGHIDDFRLGPGGDLVVTFSPQDATRVWFRGQLRHVLPGHVAAVSPDGRWLATGTSHNNQSGEVRVFSADDGQARFEWESGPIRVIEFSPDGRYVLAGGSDGRVQVWGLEAGERRYVWSLLDQWVTSVAFSPEARFLVACTVRDVEVRDLDSGQRRFAFRREQWVSNCLVSPDGSRLVTTSHDGTAHLYDSADGETLAVMHHGGRIDWAAITPDGRRVVTAGNGTVQVWDMASGEREQRIEVDRLSDIAVSADSRTVVAATHGTSAHAFDLRNGQPTATYSSRPFASRVDISPDGQVLGVGGAGFFLYDLATGAQLLRVSQSSFAIADLEFSPDGRYLLGSYWSRGTVVWDLAGTNAPFRTDGKLAGWTGREARFWAGGDCCGGRLRLWDATSRRLVWELEHPLPILLAAASPDGAVVATASETGQVRVWSGSTGELLAELSTPKSRPYGLTVPASDLVAVGYDDGSVRVWKVGGSEPWRTFHHDTREPVRVIESSPDGRLLASAATNERRLVVWNLDGGPHRTWLGPPGAALNDIAFSADGDEVFAAWSRPNLFAWDLGADEQRVLPTGQGDVSNLAVSADGRFLASGLRNGEIQLWHGDDPGPRTFRVQSPPVSGVAIDPQGRWLAGAGNDGSTMLWNVLSGEEIARLTTLASGGWAVTTPDGRWDAADQGRVTGLLAWDRGFASSLANVPQYRVPGLLQEVMAPWRKAPGEAAMAQPVSAGGSDDSASSEEPAAEETVAAAWHLPGSKPAAPEPRVRIEHVASLHLPEGARDLSVHGSRAAVATRRNVVRFVDLAEPGRPVLGESVDLARPPEHVELTADHLFATDGRNFYSVEVSAASRPGQSAVLEVESPEGFAVEGEFVYLASGLQAVHVIDVETPLRARVVASESLEPRPGAAKVVLERDQIAYVGGAVNGDAGIQLIDVAEPSHPRTVGSLPVAGSSLHGLVLAGDLLFVAAGNGGLSIFDVGEPRQVELISQFDTLALLALEVVGDKVFLADRVEGLLVVDVSDPATPRRIGEYGRSELGEDAAVLDLVALDDQMLLVSLGRSGVQILRWSATD